MVNNSGHFFQFEITDDQPSDAPHTMGICKVPIQIRCAQRECSLTDFRKLGMQCQTHLSIEATTL